MFVPQIRRPNQARSQSPLCATGRYNFITTLVTSTFAVLLLLTPVAYAEQKCNGPSWTPDSRFELRGEEAYDKVTKLTWKRCVEGMKWEGGNCTGTEKFFTWNEATNQFSKNSKGFRLPTIDELSSIRDGNDFDSESSSQAGLVMSGCVPALNYSIFKDKNPGSNWSDSFNPELPDYPWAVFFYNGHVGVDYKNSKKNIRLVRGDRFVGVLSKLGTLTTQLDIENLITKAKEKENIELKRIAAEKSRIVEQMLKNPRSAYLFAGSKEDAGDINEAKDIYRKLIKKFPDSDFAIKANDRLSRLRDVDRYSDEQRRTRDTTDEAANRVARQTAAAREEASQRQRDFCSGKSSCYGSCTGLSWEASGRCYNSCNSQYSGC